MKVFVTGGSGFVGGHLIAHLVGLGHEVSGLARSEASAAAVARQGARPVRGDLQGVAAGDLRGADAVVHCAAFAEAWGTREEFWQANVAGTERLLAAAREAGVPRFLFVGTEAAFFVGRDLAGIDEDAPYPARQRYLYSETKAEAERRVLAANAPGFTTLSIRPRLVWGPRDTSVMAAIAAAARAGRFAWISGGRAHTSTTHVKNLAHALALALTRGAGGRAYFVADDGERDLRDFFTRLLATQGVALGARSIPLALAYPLAVAVEALWRALRLAGEPPLTRMAVAMMGRSVTVSTRRAREELGYAPLVGVDQGLAELARDATT